MAKLLEVAFNCQLDNWALYIKVNKEARDCKMEKLLLLAISHIKMHLYLLIKEVARVIGRLMIKIIIN